MSGPTRAIIGGTGLYGLPGVEELRRLVPDSKFGKPSGAFVHGRWHGQEVIFLARHGEGHSIPPHRVNYRANIDALRQLGITQIIAVNAVGGIDADLGPAALCVPDQIIDYTHGRLSSFSDFHDSAVEHVDFTEPFSVPLRDALAQAAQQAQQALRMGGVLGVTQGPRLETRAEIQRMHRDGCAMVGMTSMPEAVLAREAKMEYASLCVVANWAAGVGGGGEIGMDEIRQVLEEGMRKVAAVLAAWLRGGA